MDMGLSIHFSCLVLWHGLVLFLQGCSYLAFPEEYYSGNGNAVG